MRLLLIGGSVRRPSYTSTLLRAIAAEIERSGATAVIWDLCDHPLPIADPNYYDRTASHPSPVVRKLGEEAAAARGFVLASPVYHNSYSGALKNALDHLAIRHFRRKPVALVSHGSSRGCIQACDHLRIVVRGLHGLGTAQQLATIDRDFSVVDGSYEVINPQVTRRVGELVNELLVLASLLAVSRSPARAEALKALLGGQTAKGPAGREPRRTRSKG